MPTSKHVSRGKQLQVLNDAIVECVKCPDLRSYCAEIGATKRRAYEDCSYWARPVPGFGDPNARLLIVGLAPGAHGANRTGRVFTGDRSGDFLFAGLHRVGLANQAQSTDVSDGLALIGVYISIALRCAPPANKPTRTQLEACQDYLAREMDILTPRAVLCLGGIAFQSMLRWCRSHGLPVPKPLPKFGHGVEVALGKMTLIGCYHVSQQNTFTGRLTPSMLDQVLDQARRCAFA